jgi:hypothetical protein
MRIPSLLTVSAVVLALFGLVLVLRTGDALTAFGHSAAPIAGADDAAALDYWRTAAFARLFGMTLLAFGMLLWHLKPLVSPGAERRIGLTLAAGLGLVGLLALGQQIAVFGTPAGWVVPVAFLALALASGAAAFRAERSTP